MGKKLRLNQLQKQHVDELINICLLNENKPVDSSSANTHKGHQQSTTNNHQNLSICSRKELEKIVANTASPKNNFSSRLLFGWRYKVVGEKIEQFLTDGGFQTGRK